METKYVYLTDEFWLRAYYIIYWSALVSCLPWPPEYDETCTYQTIKWPLPRNRVYEVAPIGDITYVLRRASDTVKDVTPEREGETLGYTCSICATDFTKGECPHNKETL